MNVDSPPAPTLWRTCRALANRHRLQILELLFHEPDQTVSAVAARLRLQLSVASAYLRMLESRGLLTVRRVGRRVSYSPITATGDAAAPRLVAGLRTAFAREHQSVEFLFKLATAFTHPRRVAIYGTLTARSQTLPELQATTGISGRALARHLRKLETRGMVGCRLGTYGLATRQDAFGRELARLAGGPGR